MKKYFSFLPALLLSFAFIACSDDYDVLPASKPDAPEVELKVGTVDPYSFTFTVTSANAKYASWVWQTGAEEAPDVDLVLSQGMPVKSAEPIALKNLVPEKEYNIYAAVLGLDGTKVLSSVLKVNTGGETFAAVQELVDASYRTDNPARTGQYELTIASGKVDKYGEPQKVGDYVLAFSLYNNPVEDLSKIELPAGEYVVGTSCMPLTWSPSEGICIIRTEKKVEIIPLVDGRIMVERDDKGGYVIDASTVLFTGERRLLRYTGDIEFIQTGFSNDRFTRPQNVTFENVEKNFFYGNWTRPHADDMNLHFYSGKFNEKHKQTHGYYMSLPVYMNKVDNPMDPNVALQEGVYTITKGRTSQITSLPMTIERGVAEDFWGSLMIVGANITYINGRNGHKELGILTEGTMTVTRTGGDNYKFVFKFKTEEGIDIDGVYEGPFKLSNKCDNDTKQPKRPWSTVKEDRVLKMPNGQEAQMYLMGDYLIPGMMSCQLNIAPTKNEGDMFTAEFFCKGETLQPGTYTIVHDFKYNCAFPGWLSSNGGPLFAWYGDMSSTQVDEQGDSYVTVLAPMTKGTFTVSKVGENYKIVFDMYDDATPAHRFTGEWTGPVTVHDARTRSAAAFYERPTLDRLMRR